MGKMDNMFNFIKSKYPDKKVEIRESRFRSLDAAKNFCKEINVKTLIVFNDTCFDDDCELNVVDVGRIKEDISSYQLTSVDKFKENILQNASIRIYSYNYNAWRIISGMGGLSYAS